MRMSSTQRWMPAWSRRWQRQQAVCQVPHRWGACAHARSGGGTAGASSCKTAVLMRDRVLPGGCASLRRSRPLDETELRARRDDTRETEAGSGVQLSILLLRPLAAAVHHQHLEIEELHRRRVIAWRDQRLNDQDLALWRHCLGAVAQNDKAVRVVPIMDDLAQQVDVASGQRRVEEVTAYAHAARGDARLFQRTRRAGDDVWLVKEHTTQPRMGLQYRSEQDAMPAADIHHDAGGGIRIGTNSSGD